MVLLCFFYTRKILRFNIRLLWVLFLFISFIGIVDFINNKLNVFVGKNEIFWDFTTYFIPNTKKHVFFCDMEPLDIIEGSQRNVVMVHTNKYNPRLQITAKSLRTCDISCRMLIFVPKSFKIPDLVVQIFLEMNVEIIYENIPLKSKFPQCYRFEIEKIWLENHLNEVDLVFHCDSLDSYFQSSPFSHGLIDHDKLLFASEDVLIKNCPINSRWMKRAYGNDISIWNNNIINGGTIGGNAKLYYKFLNKFINSSDYKNCQRFNADQAILMHMIWSGDLFRWNIPYLVKGCCNGLWSAYCAHAKKNGVGYIINQKKQLVTDNIRCYNSLLPVFVHQYNRFKYLIENFTRRCHVI